MSVLRQRFSSQEIALRVAAMGKAIDADYANTPLVMICVLKGASIFFADLVRTLQNPHITLDFVRLSSYGTQRTSAPSVKITKDVEVSLSEKHVLVVEDIIDTGRSMLFLQEYCMARGAKSFAIATLIDKYERRKALVQAKYVGFACKQGFIVGYGLDDAEKYRNLPALYEIIDA